MVIHALFSELFEPLRTFLTSDSGYVQPREGLGLGWVAGALAALAAIFSIGDAKADWNICQANNMEPDTFAWLCTSEPCTDSQGAPGFYRRKFYYALEPLQCYPVGNPVCACN